MLFWTLSLLLAAPAWAVDADGDGADELVDCDDNDPFRSPDFVDDDCDDIDDCDGVTDDGCPCEIAFRGSMYLICADALSWSDQSAACNDLGAELASFGSTGQNLVIANASRDVGIGQYWIGLNDRDVEGEFVWSNGEASTYTRWGNNQPDNASPDHDCATLDNDTYFWATQDCATELPAICEKPCGDGWYYDFDGDGIGSIGTPAACGEPPPGVVSVTGDCDDANPDAYPGAVEICDGLGVDEDCNGLADELDPASGAQRWGLDGDGDGYGDEATSILTCTPPGGDYVVAGDCDDADPLLSPGSNNDLCNGLDDDCDGVVDDDCPCVFDAYEGGAYLFCDAITDWQSAQSACTRYDGNLAVVEDAAENDWIGQTARAIDTARWWIGLSDLEEETEWVWVDGSDTPYRNWHGTDGGFDDDEDCVAIRDNVDLEWIDHFCDWNQPYVCEVGCRVVYADVDGDGFGDPSSGRTVCAEPPSLSVEIAGDCDDSRSDVYPGAVERCDPDDVDEDCDGLADDADDVALGKTTWYLDADLDGFGDPGVPLAACDAPLNATDNDEDCDDTTALVSPLATERCNGEDDDCDQRSDEDTVDDDDDGICDLLDPCPGDVWNDANRDGVCDGDFVLQPVGFATGEVATIWAVNAAPADDVYLGLSVRGPGPGPCAPTADGGTICAGLTSLIPLGVVPADNSGNAFTQLTVPPSVAPGTTVWLQALTLGGSGAATPVAEVVIQCPDSGDPTDGDGDGVASCLDVCPCDPTDTCTDPLAAFDTDRDGICDDVDTCNAGADVDLDGICDDVDTCLTGADVDLDGICDDVDTCLTGADVDGDSICDDVDTCLTGADVDGDSICDDVDTCLTGADVDGDSICDDVDTCLTGADTDGDGVCDADDNCVDVANPDQYDVGDGARTPLDVDGSPTEMLWLGAVGGTGCDDVSGLAGIEATTPLDGDTFGGLTWTQETSATGRWDIRALFGQINSYAYGVAYVLAPSAMDVQVQWCSDDGADFWLNGELQTSVTACRRLRITDELTPIRLEQGLNTLMWRVTQAGGGWELEYRLQDLTGAPLQLDTMVAPAPNGIADACEVGQP
jgi:hypothetical protein